MPTLMDRLSPLLLPGILLYNAIKVYVQLFFRELLSNGRIPPDFRDKAFGTFWEGCCGGPPDPTVPLAGSQTLVPPLLAQARGTVLEIGPGSGNQIMYYEPAAAQIDKLYAAEPAKELHRVLRKNADATTLGPKYMILDSHATKASIGKGLVKHDAVPDARKADGMFDTIICVRVLCSVPDLSGTVSDLHDLLRPGGRLIIVEHTINPWRTPKGSLIARIVQSLYMLIGWSYFVGDCSLVRDIETMLRADSSRRWKSVDIDRHFGHAVLCYISGILTKSDAGDA